MFAWTHSYIQYKSMPTLIQTDQYSNGYPPSKVAVSLLTVIQVTPKSLDTLKYCRFLFWYLGWTSDCLLCVRSLQWRFLLFELVFSASKYWARIVRPWDHREKTACSVVPTFDKGVTMLHNNTPLIHNRDTLFLAQKLPTYHHKLLKVSH